MLRFAATPAQDAQSRSGAELSFGLPDRLCKGESSTINPTTTSITTQIWKKAKHAPLTRDIVGLAHTHPLKQPAKTLTNSGVKR